MSWQGQLSTIVRHLLNDVDHTNYKYTSKRLETTIIVAAQLVILDADFNNTYSINVESCQLSPDPTDLETKDNAFITLVALKSACIILGSEARTESGNAISIKDGPSAIDLRGVSGTLLTLYKDLSEKYEQALTSHLAGNSMFGAAILGPYSPASDFVTRNYSDSDLRGGYFRY